MNTVLIPPLLCSPLVYGPLLDTVWSYGAAMLADTRRDDTVAAIAARVLRDAPEEFAVVGTSMGGYVALEIVRQAPERVKALALVSTSARADTPDQILARQQQSHLVKQGQFESLVDAAFPSMVAEDNEPDQGLLATWRATAATVGADTFVRQQRANIGRSDLRYLLPTIDCPTAIIHGADDRLIPLELARETAAAMPNARFTVIEGAGHFIFQEQPAAAANAVAELLEGVS
jgi:pimeloyl-ACP methyl ester carboxylesterase